MSIDGHTRTTGVIGWPIAQSLSPVMHNAAYRVLDLNWACLPFGIPDAAALDAFLDAARHLSFVGFNVTMPYKQEMLHRCDEVAELARIAGAVNTVHCVDGRLIGYNTDARGLLEALEDAASFKPEGTSVALVGAGGAAGAAIAACALAKVGDLAVLNRDLSRAERAVAQVGPYLGTMEVAAHELGEASASLVRDADLVINATPVGMREGDPSPIPRSWLRAGQIVFDMVYRPGPTALVRDAESVGAHAIDGLGMLVAQGALAIDIWVAPLDAGLRAPRDVMRAAAELALCDQRAEGGIGQ